MQLNLTFFPLPNFTEVILDQDIECRPQPPENDQNPNKVIYQWVLTSVWVRDTKNLESIGVLVIIFLYFTLKKTLRNFFLEKVYIKNLQF
jgi:hypothetical protein